MLLPADVLPFLSADDPVVRTHATRYFTGAHDAGPLTAEHVWDAIDRAGLTRSTGRLLRLLPGLPQTDASTDRLLAALDAAAATAAVSDHPEDDLLPGWMLDALDDMDFDQLRRHRDRILGRADLSVETRAHLEERLRLVDVPLDDLWDEFLKHATPAADEYWDDVDHDAKFRLTEALARHGDAAAGRALALVNPAVISDDFSEPFAIDLLGHMRYRPALDVLVRRFVDADDDDDSAHESLQAAIPRVGGVDAVAPIARHFADRSWTYQIYAAELLARVKHPDCEAALTALLDEPNVAEARDHVAHALLTLCTTGALPALREIVIVNPDYDRQAFDLEAEFVAAALMADYDFPELAELRAEVLADELEDRRRMDAGEFDLGLNDLDRLADDEFGGRGDPDDWDDDVSYPALPETLDDRHPAPTPTIRNAGPKVGRNDPCPCGSGKKYKKCCLDKG